MKCTYGTYVYDARVWQTYRPDDQYLAEVGPQRRAIIVQRDRFVRFGYDYFEAFCERHHTELIVVNGDTMSPQQELVQDLLAIITVFGAWLHGRRSYKKVLKDAALQKD